MKQIALQQFNLTWLPISGLIIFLICFTLYTYWTFKKENKAVYDRASMIPLEEEVNERR